MNEIELDTLIVMDYRTFYTLLRRVEAGEKVDDLVDELVNQDVPAEDDAASES